MKGNLFFKFIIVVFLSSCSSTKPLIREVSQKYYNYSFTPETAKRTSSNNTEITVMPIDAKSLNKETYEAAMRDGNYEKEFVSVIQTWRMNLNTLPKKEKIYIQGKINALNLLSTLERNGTIPPNVSFSLKKRIVDESIGNDGTEIESLGDLTFSSSEFNPYKGNVNYFSVFKLTFENKGEAIEKLNLKDFQVVSNEEQLYPLGLEYFEKNLGGKTETIKNSYRMNMPDELTITPKQRINKYIAVPAINTDNNKLQIQFIKNGTVANFDFNILKKETEKKYNLQKFDLIGSGNVDNSFKFFYVISYKDNVSYALKDYQLFVSDERKKIQANVYAIAINPYNSDISFGTATDFTFSNEKSVKKKIIFKIAKKDKGTDQY